MTKRLAAVVLGYGAEPLLLACLTALRAQLDPELDELIVVDNGVPAEIRQALDALADTVVGDGANSGFAGGCNAGVDATDAEIVVFVNSDAVLRAGALDILSAALVDPTCGIVGGCLRLADQPDLINSVGNPLQFLGFTWAGHCGEPAADHAESTTVPVATGGLFALRRTTWVALGGFEPTYFAYHEDTDLSLRCWLSGREVRVEPLAIADHDYEFARNPRKMYLVERNRLITVLCDYPAPLLRRVLPALILVEIPLSAVALLTGWGRQKLGAWWWVLRQRRWIAARRRRVQDQVVVPWRSIAALLTAEIAPPMVPKPPGTGLLNVVLRGYWNRVRRWGG